MDIIDIILAKKLASSAASGTQQLVDEANKTLEETKEQLSTLSDAVDSAQQTITDAQAAVDAIGEIEQQAQDAAQKAQDAAASFDQMKEDLVTAAEGLVDETVTNVVDREMGAIKDDVTALQTSDEEQNVAISELQEKLGNVVTNVTVADASTEEATIQELTVTKGEESTKYEFKSYTGSGENTDGAMTQKAVTDYVISVKEELEEKINTSTSSTNLGKENAGKTVVVGEDGNIIPGSVTEDDIIKLEMTLGTYTDKEVVGVEIDYVNKTCSRIQGATGLASGSSFDKFPMYGGRKRCIVDNSGLIVAFSDDLEYEDDGSKGQVMVYQPKFYYSRIPLTFSTTSTGTVATKEQILISSVKKAGFKLHPLFINDDGLELDYALIPAYEGSVYKTVEATYITDDAGDIDFDNDQLSSVRGTKPASTITPDNFRKLAANRGDGWKLTNLKFENVNQLLMMIEYGTPNLQSTVGKGICDLPNSTSKNIAIITGSTSNLKNATGRAQTSSDGESSYTEEGKVAFSYRGVENPYGNIWRLVDEVVVNGNGSQNGGVATVGNQVMSFSFPNTSDWIAAFGYDASVDWVLLPTSFSNSPNSALPIGDFNYSTPNLRATNSYLIGGKGSTGDYVGPFCGYASFGATASANSLNARIMYIPTTNDKTNYNKWLAKMGG